jgi:hypothetical protein
VKPDKARAACHQTQHILAIQTGTASLSPDAPGGGSA